MAPRKDKPRAEQDTKSGAKRIYVDFDLSEVKENDMEAYESAGIMIWGAHELNRWRLGDLGSKVVRTHKAASIKSFATRISNGACSKGAMYDYIATSVAYNEWERAEFPTLSWSHYRQAKGKAVETEEGLIVGTIKHDIAMTWLGKAADNDWTVAELKAAMEGNPNKEVGGGTPEKIKLVDIGAEFMGGGVDQQEEDGTPLSYAYSIRTFSPITLPEHRIYTLEMYGVPEDEADHGDS